MLKLAIVSSRPLWARQSTSFQAGNQAIKQHVFSLTKKQEFIVLPFVLHTSTVIHWNILPTILSVSMCAVHFMSVVPFVFRHFATSSLMSLKQFVYRSMSRASGALGAYLFIFLCANKDIKSQVRQLSFQSCIMA